MLNIQASPTTTTINSLLRENLIHIGTHLEAIDLARACRVCHLWKDIFSNHPKWKEFYINSQYPQKPIPIGENFNWKILYSKPKCDARAFGRNILKFKNIAQITSSNLTPFHTNLDSPLLVNGLQYEVKNKETGGQFFVTENGAELWNQDLICVGRVIVQVNNLIGGILHIPCNPYEPEGLLFFNSISSRARKLHLWDSLHKSKPEKIVEASAFTLVNDRAITLLNGDLYSHSLTDSRRLTNEERDYWAPNNKDDFWAFFLPSPDQNLIHLMSRFGQIATFSLNTGSVLSRSDTMSAARQMKEALIYGEAIFALDDSGDFYYTDPLRNVHRKINGSFHNLKISDGIVTVHEDLQRIQISPKETRTPVTFFQDLFKKK